MTRQDGAAPLGNWMPVRVGVGIAQLGGNPVFQPLGDEMLQALGLLMHLVPRIAEKLVQKSLEQPMVAQHLEGPHFSGIGQAYAVMLLIFHECGASRGKLLKHPRHRCRANSQMPGERIAGYPLFRRAAEFQNRLQVVIHRLRRGGMHGFSRH